MIKLQTLCPKCKKIYEYANLDNTKLQISYSVTNGLFYLKCTCNYVFVPTPVAIVDRVGAEVEKEKEVEVTDVDEATGKVTESTSKEVKPDKESEA